MLYVTCLHTHSGRIGVLETWCQFFVIDFSEQAQTYSRKPIDINLLKKNKDGDIDLTSNLILDFLEKFS